MDAEKALRMGEALAEFERAADDATAYARRAQQRCSALVALFLSDTKAAGKALDANGEVMGLERQAFDAYVSLKRAVRVAVQEALGS